MIQSMQFGNPVPMFWGVWDVRCFPPTVGRRVMEWIQFRILYEKNSCCLLHWFQWIAVHSPLILEKSGWKHRNVKVLLHVCTLDLKFAPLTLNPWLFFLWCRLKLWMMFWRDVCVSFGNCWIHVSNEKNAGCLVYKRGLYYPVMWGS